ncbi:DUF3102 domain-containing protein [uncultured Rhodospira sp.]|uniref:DUF3102 domain-containing protein n=1 Tax=uncultured Rhodospira sp. TaxID=1936189 RepID=UPI00260C1E18|nr:DUF3102 domain-containing protein [uncultured Rhodospira sp.]
MTDTIETLKSTALSVPPLTALAWEINDAHQDVQDHAEGMLLAAKRAGDALLKVKTECKHGVFKTWVADNCRFSYANAHRYMQVAQRFQKSPVGDISEIADVSIREFLGRSEKPKTTPPFTQADAEYAQKLHAMATRGEGNEADVAKTKLDTFAKGFGMSGEEAVGGVATSIPTRSNGTTSCTCFAGS